MYRQETYVDVIIGRVRPQRTLSLSILNTNGHAVNKIFELSHMRKVNHNMYEHSHLVRLEATIFALGLPLRPYLMYESR